VSIFVGASVATTERAHAGWWDDLDKGESVRLSDVFADPHAHRDRLLTFVCILMGRDEVFLPLQTPFNPQRHDNVAVWEDGTPVWEETAFKEKIRPYLYVEKRHPQREALLAAPRSTRIEVTARVRAIVRGIPFLEILSWRPTGYRLGDDVVTSLVAGDNHVRSGELDLGLEYYRRALRPDLARVYALLVKKRMSDVLHRMGRHDEAARVEGDEVRGGTFAPDSPAPMPGDVTPFGPPAEGATPPPIATELPGTAVDVPVPVTTGDELPGTEVGSAPAPAGRPPVAPPVVAPPPGSVPPAAWPPAPVVTPAPVAPPTGPPPSAAPPPPLGPPPPVVTRPGSTAPLPLPPTAVAQPPPPAATATPPPAAPAPVAPPKRNPRLEGVR
jgi:hypothetical protein